MANFKKLKKNITHRRFGQWLRVNLKFTRRRVRRFFVSSPFRKLVLDKYGRSFAVSVLSLLLSVAVLIVVAIGAGHRNTEGMLIKRLTYGTDYDSKVPYFKTLEAIGSSNHLAVTVKTAAIDNIRERTVSLLSGGINLKVSFTDGTSKELPLKRKYRLSPFTAGQEANFIVTLPFGYTPFDISTTALVITPGADGQYDDWSCERANVSFMLGGSRVQIAKSDWTTPKRFGAQRGAVRAMELADSRGGNTNYHQLSLLFDRLLALAPDGLQDEALKADTLDSLGLANVRALYMDVETVSATTNAKLKNELGEKGKLPLEEDLNYNGTLTAIVTFNAKTAEGGYRFETELDIPGKDDFEMGSASTFRIDLPEGMSVFDVSSVSILPTNPEDAWAPRFVRLYITLDFDCELELGRLTDKALTKQYDTPIFYKGFLDSPISFDLGAQNAIPEIRAAEIKEEYGHTLSDAAYAMYFEKQSFFSRQIRFFEQMAKLKG